jgi:hypothetical protein
MVATPQGVDLFRVAGAGPGREFAARRNAIVSYVYVVQMDIPQHLEAEFNRIYDEDHVPTILKVPGVRSCARYRLDHSTIPTMPRYLAIYEVDSAEIINSPAWQEASDLGEWKPKIRPHTTNRQHSVFRKIA